MLSIKMAAIPRKHFFPICNLSLLRLRDGFRAYSQYSPIYKAPVFTKQELEKLMQEVSKEDLSSVRRKAALNSQTCSVFYDADIEKFVNYVMRKGKKQLAKEIVSTAFTYVKHIQLRKYNQETDELKKREILLSPQEVFHLAVKNTTPVLNLHKLKKSGSWYRIPVAISPSTAKVKAMKWIIEAAKEKPQSIPMYKELAEEFVKAAHKEGKAYQKKVEFHKVCEANRGYAHYQWG